ncbi:MAG: hydrogenase maturation protease [Actinoplanes sp.]|nr:hydrogenase maturation protease [Actinoplanes sp.]
MTGRVLVAGVGNLFLGDDGFGPEVARRLAEQQPPLPGRVTVVDYGIRGMHLAYDLLAGYDALVLVDALPGRDASGQVVVLRVTAGDLTAGDAGGGDPGAGDLGGGFDAHGMDPAAMLAGVARLGGTLPATYLVGCRVARVDEEIGLSGPVAAAVPAAMDAVRELVSSLNGRD